MTSLRVALIVPGSGAKWAYDEATVRKWIAKGDVDLVVFPEGTFEVTASRDTLADAREVATETARNLALDLGAPTLAGLTVLGLAPGGLDLQAAAYSNPRPARGETTSHFYAKHSTARVLPYEIDDYPAEREAMFQPIALRGSKVGVLICHDQFFGLVGEKLARAGADAFIDLTGSDVVRSKWRNVIAGRSLERGVGYLCTMTRNLGSESSNVAFAVGMRSGCELRPVRKSTHATRGDVVLYDMQGTVEALDAQQNYSPQVYDELTIALAPSRSPADLQIGPSGIDAMFTGREGAWDELTKHGKRIGVLTLPATELRDPMCIHRHELHGTSFDAHVVCFVGPKDVVSNDEAIVLARLRAIEHRMAVVLCTPGVRELLRATRYKNMQRFREQESGIFGLDLAHMGGTYASMDGGKALGIPAEWQACYRALLSPLDSKPGSARKARTEAKKPRAPERVRPAPRAASASTRKAAAQHRAPAEEPPPGEHDRSAEELVATALQGVGRAARLIVDGLFGKK
jgi:predicted amidohydrolase